MPPSAPNPHSAGEFGQLGREVCRQQAPPEPQKLQRAWYLKLSRPQERPQHGWLRLLTGCHGGSGGEGGSGVDMDGRTLEVRIAELESSNGYAHAWPQGVHKSEG